MFMSHQEPLFRAKDVADWIEHSNVSAMIQSIDEDEKVTINITYSEQCLCHIKS